jgi:hypothetical protein
LVLGAAAAGRVFGQQARQIKTVMLGDTQVHLVIYDVPSRSSAPFVFFHPHENEHASALVTRHAIRSMGGRLIEVRSRGERLIRFRLMGASYVIDPNRIFTDWGAARALGRYGPSKQGAVDAARNLGKAIVNLLGGGKRPIVAMHNNTEDGLTALSFQKGGKYAEQAAKVALNPKEPVHNFFLVLDEGLFSKLHHAGFNTVLHSPDAPDDGSLSYFCSDHKWPYVNVEAFEGSMSGQERMIEALRRLFV